MESHYREKMNKAAARNLQNVRFVTDYEGAVITSLSPTSFKKLAEAAGATKKIGRATRYDIEIVKQYLADQGTGEK